MNQKGEKILAVIIARGGSKSIPGKNLLDFKGKPLVAWPIELAKSVSQIDRVIISTDSADIAETAKKYGAEVPFMRPAELATDDAPTLPVLQHAVKFLEENQNFKADIILLFYPTSPMLSRSRVEEALLMLESSDCNSVVSVVEDHGRFWEKTEGAFKVFYPKDRLNRQYFQPLYRENGAIYFSRYVVLMNQNKIIDESAVKLLVMAPDESVDIDNWADLAKAKR
ncbi:MAG: acylneuraminate cytidylyltransferase family protein [Candidatus Buchananbacteria bacterium]|nr:acylneuraminate cytidylyltransferase family protein [Candidatus Buchananbacteria bacterium]